MVLLRGGTILSSTGAHRGDVLLNGERVVEIGPDLDQGDAAVVDVGGALLLPGGVDPHVRFRPDDEAGGSSIDFACASCAALAGGTTTVIDLAEPTPGQSLTEALEARIAEASLSWCDYALHQGVDRWDERIRDELRVLAEERGVRSFEVATARRGGHGLDDAALLEAMETAATLGLVVLARCEEGAAIDYLSNRLYACGFRDARWQAASHPPTAESPAVARACAFAEITGARLHLLHVSTAASCAAIARSRQAGAPITGEAWLHHLVLSTESYEGDALGAARLAVTPPLRSPEDRQALWLALEQGVLDEVASDHCPIPFHNAKERLCGDFRHLPSGLPGVRERLPLIYSLGVAEERMAAWDWVALVAENAARIFGLYPRKGTIAPGSDADIVVWDPAGSSTIHAGDALHDCDYSPYEGIPLRGSLRSVYLRGRLMIDDGELVAQGSGGVLLRPRLPAR